MTRAVPLKINENKTIVRWVGEQAVRRNKQYKCLHYRFFDTAGIWKRNNQLCDCHAGIPQIKRYYPAFFLFYAVWQVPVDWHKQMEYLP